jgi:steroid delta-isomerase
MIALKDIPFTSLSAVKAGDRAGWLALFTDDAVVEDPVGPYDWDPEGVGQRGKAAIAAFYDMFSAFQSAFDFDIHHQEPRGNEVAVFVSMHITMKDGTRATTKAINIYRTGPDGRVNSLRSFWNA